MSTPQKTIAGVVLVLALGTGVYEIRENSKLREQVKEHQAQEARLTKRVQQLQRQVDQATHRLTSLAEDAAKTDKQKLELLRLRGMAGMARQATAEVEQLRAQLARQTNEADANPVTKAMGEAMKQAVAQQVEGRLARLTASLQLTPEQSQAARNILMRQAQAVGEGMQQAMSGKFDKEKLAAAAREGGDPDSQIKALLTPEQQAAYPDYQQQEAAHNARLAANSEMVQLQTSLDLTPEQRDQVHAALYEVSLNQLTGNVKPPPGAVTQTADVMQWAMEQKAKALEPLLTPAQFEKYRDQLALQAKLVKDIANKMEGAGSAK